ncbi:MAG: VWA domain-containing protein [Pseudomonadota bacterium]|nr:VWA domain-containing protein [Pseudomonadota bacterium]
MLTLLALLSCQALTQAKTPIPEVKPPPVLEEEPVRAVRMPTGEVVVRECYGGSTRDTGSARRNQGSPPPPPSAAASSAPTSVPPGNIGTIGTTGPSGGAGYGTGGRAGGLASSTATGSAPGDAPAASAPAAKPTTSQPAASQPAKSASTTTAARRPTTPLADMTSEKEGDAVAAGAPAVAQAEASRADDSFDGGETRSKKKDESKLAGAKRTESGAAMEEQERASFADPNLDWGATVYLSNDDSMSLASAQRLLWAIQNKGPVSTSQVRPHELLNYFSFETDPVERGDTFSVKGSAEQTAPDVVTFAFAVKGIIPQREPLDLTMVLDRSGSMSAEGRMEYLKRGLTKMSDQLVRGDRVDLVLFDDQVCTPLENFVVGRDDPSLLATAIGNLAPRGSTNVDIGMKEGYRIANSRNGGESDGRNRRMMLISDALLNTGDINPNTVTEVAKALEESDIRLTAVGVGRDFNDKVLDMLSEKGKGAYVYLGSEAVVDRVFGLGFPSLVQTVAHDVRFALDLPPSLAMKRFYGEESSTNKEDVQPIHYFAGTTQLFLQDLQLNGRPVPNDPVTLTIEWKDVDNGAPRTQAFTTTVGALLDSDPRNMRKARALMGWTDLILARSMGGSPCGQPFSVWQERVSVLGEDAEIQWLDGLTSPLCGATPIPPKPAARGVAFKVKVDSDLPIAEVGLTCSGRTQTEALSGSDTIARFASATPGGCTLTLQGNVPMNASVEVPTTGGEVRCTVRGGRVNCG